MNFEEYQYLNTVVDVLKNGEKSSNRTGIDTLFKFGLSMKFNLQNGFPLLTTKKMAWKSAFAEMLGFLRGYDNAADFRKLGCHVWDQNANENEEWLNNPFRKGTDDIGRAYGVQWRQWRTNNSTTINQLKKVYDDLRQGKDNRREIVTAWNPAELDRMALPPCHMFMQFGIRRSEHLLDLSVYIRSNDIGLGMPFNIAQYAFLLTVMAQITGYKPGTLHYFAFNYHIYENHIKPLKEQVKRIPRDAPTIYINPDCDSLEFLETTKLPIEKWVEIDNYNPHPYIKMEMAV